MIKNILFETLQENTHIVGLYIDLRTQSYFKNVMGPVFGVDSSIGTDNNSLNIEAWFIGTVFVGGLIENLMICNTKSSQLVFLKNNVTINCPSGLVRISVLLLIILLARIKLVVQTNSFGYLQNILLPHIQKNIAPFQTFNECRSFSRISIRGSFTFEKSIQQEHLITH